MASCSHALTPHPSAAGAWDKVGTGRIERQTSPRLEHRLPDTFFLLQVSSGEAKRGCDISRLRVFIVGLVFILITGALVAQTGRDDRAVPKPLRFDFTPLIGYRTSMSLTIQPQVQPVAPGATPRAVFDANPSYGLAFGVRLDEENLVEFRWAREDTHIHVEDFTQNFSKQRVTLDQFHGDFTHEYFIEDWPPWARPFIVGSVGATHVSVSANNGFTRFSFGIGGGIKVFASRHLGFKIQAQWLPVLVNPEVRAFVCGSGCVVRIGGQLISQGEVTTGPVLRF
jgi:hypothetical protein